MKSQIAECYPECRSFPLTTERRKVEKRNGDTDQGKKMALRSCTWSWRLGTFEREKEKQNKTKNKYKERDIQENDNELNILAKLKKENQLTKILHCDVTFISCAFPRSQIKEILKVHI